MERSHFVESEPESWWLVRKDPGYHVESARRDLGQRFGWPDERWYHDRAHLDELYSHLYDHHSHLLQEIDEATDEERQVKWLEAVAATAPPPHAPQHHAEGSAHHSESDPAHHPHDAGADHDIEDAAHKAAGEVVAEYVDVWAQYEYMFDEQNTGLDRLEKSLENKKADAGLIATIAGAAVGATVGLVLGPVAAAVPGLVGDASPFAQKMIEKLLAKSVEAAKAGAAEGARQWKSKETEEKNGIADFVQAQRHAINEAKRSAHLALGEEVAAVAAKPWGHKVLADLATSIRARAQQAQATQIAESAGQWAALSARAGDKVDWADGSAQGYRGPDESEKGEIEIWMKVAKAPVEGPGDFEIVKSNWAGITRDTENLVERQKGVKLTTLGANLRLYIETPMFGEVHCEILANNPGNPVVPDRSDWQQGLVWVVMGSSMPSGNLDHMAVVSSAAAIGYYVGEKTVDELKFGG